MGDAVRAVIEPGADADEPDGEPMQHGSISEEFKRPHRCERRDRIGERHKAGFREARGHAEHVLLGDADVEESFRMRVPEGLENGIAKVASEQHHSWIQFREPNEGVGKGRPHVTASSSSSAWAN